MDRYKILKNPEDKKPCFAPVEKKEEKKPRQPQNLLASEIQALVGRGVPWSTVGYTGMDYGGYSRGVAGHTGIQRIPENLTTTRSPEPPPQESEAERDLRMMHGIDLRR